MKRTTVTTLVLVLGLVLSTRTMHGGEIGHYTPGLPNIRDLVVPQPSFYGVLYHYFYLSDERALLWRVRGPGPVPGAGGWLQCGQEVLATT